VTDINLFGALTGGVAFEVSRKAVDINVDGGSFNPGGGVDLSGALLTTFGLSLDEAAPADPETLFLRLGTPDYSLSVDDGSLAVALLAPADSSDTRRWRAIRATGLRGSLDLGGFVTATAPGIDV